MRRIRCPEREATIKDQLLATIESALGAYPPSAAVKVEASGSQYTGGERDEGTFNTVGLSIQPLYGFIE